MNSYVYPNSLSTLNLCMLCICLIISRGATAGTGDCVDSSPYTFQGTNEQREYRISGNTLDYLQNISRNEGVAAIAMGAEVWNEEANAGYFVMGPGVTRDSIPETLLGCIIEEVDYSLVVVDGETPTSAIAVTSPRCSGYAFQITIFSRNSQGGYKNFYVGQTGPNSPPYFDLVSVMAHEFGHTLGLGHPEHGEYATLKGTFAAGDDRRRDLYYWDTKCSNSISGDRSLTAYRRTHYSNNSWSSESNFPFSESVFKVAVFHTLWTGWSYCGAAALATSDGHWKHCSGCTERDLNLSNNVSLGISAGHYREDITWDHVLYAAEYPTYPYYSEDSKHYVLTRMSTNGFQSITYGSLYHCTYMDGNFSCGDNERVYTGKRMAFTWDNYTNRTVFVWADQTRLCAEPGSEYEKALNIATGYISRTLLPEPDVPTTLKSIRGTSYQYPIATSVGPAVACNAYSADGNDCIVAYVELNDPENEVRVINFWNHFVDDRYYISNVSEPYQLGYNIRTASNVAAWYHSGKFWIAIRPIRANQELEVYYSSDSVTWHRDISFGGHYSVTGPSAISTIPEYSQNRLMYVR